MTDSEYESGKADGVRDTRIANLEKEVSNLKKILYTAIGAIMASWAKITGLIGGG